MRCPLKVESAGSFEGSFADFECLSVDFKPYFKGSTGRRGDWFRVKEAHNDFAIPRVSVEYIQSPLVGDIMPKAATRSSEAFVSQRSTDSVAVVYELLAHEDFWRKFAADLQAKSLEYKSWMPTWNLFVHQPVTYREGVAYPVAPSSTETAN